MPPPNSAASPRRSWSPLGSWRAGRRKWTGSTMTNGAASPALPGALRVMKRASTAPVGDWFDLGKHLLRITAFLALAILVYSPMGGSWIHIPAAPMTREGWAAINYTAAAWDTDNWDWDGELICSSRSEVLSIAREHAPSPACRRTVAFAFAVPPTLAAMALAARCVSGCVSCCCFCHPRPVPLRSSVAHLMLCRSFGSDRLHLLCDGDHDNRGLRRQSHAKAGDAALYPLLRLRGSDCRCGLHQCESPALRALNSLPLSDGLRCLRPRARGLGPRLLPDGARAGGEASRLRTRPQAAGLPSWLVAWL